MARTNDESSLSLWRVLTVVFRPRTYKNLLYLVLAFPLAIIFNATLTVVFVVGLLLSPVGVGIALLLATVVLARLLAGLERGLANALLGLDLTAPTPRPANDGGIGGVRHSLEAPSTWRGLGFVFVKFWVGLLGFAVLVLALGAVELLTVPLEYPTVIEFGQVNEQPVRWAVDTPLEIGLAVPGGVVVGLVALHLANGFAYAAGSCARALLDAPEESVAPSSADRT